MSPPTASVTGRGLELVVRDDGMGMHESCRRRIFEPFYTTKPEGRGTGLGLSTAYGIVQQSGGYIWAESEPGKGTRFDVYLPRAEESAPVQEAEYATPSSAAEPSVRGTVLLVEDDETVRRIVREALEEDGFSVHDARDAERALAAADRIEDIDLLITDLVMPNLDGVELAKRIRKKRPRLRVLVMSGYPDKVPGAERRNGGWAFLRKPFTWDELTATLRDLLKDTAPPLRVH